MARPAPCCLFFFLLQTALGSEAPQFMLDLYRAVAGDDGVTKGHGLPQGNTVRSFLDKNHSGAQGQLLFRLSREAKQERILTAELHLFKLRPQTLGGPRRQHFCQVSVYQVLDLAGTGSPSGKKLLCSRLLSLLGSGWEVFSVTQAVHDLVSEEDNGLGLVVTVDGLPDLGSDLGLDPTVRFASGRDHHSSRKPMLVLFAQDDSPAAPLPSRVSRDVAWPLPAPSLNRIRGSRSAEVSVWAEEESDSPPAPGPCRRLPLVVEVEDLGWGGWVISPRGVGAYQCRGGCPFPLGAGLRPSNHAVLRSIARALRPPGPRAPPAPCCVPDALLPINLLYFDGGDRDNVVLKQFPDMVAASCGCR
ncbi:bone morphogenetic protein 2-like [Anolis sagrei]|uniref:bone morphogenetic protein 2-like n=1 Tax=Anolis sagrei TaxID=38937 RepID=UPI0035219214